MQLIGHKGVFNKPRLFILYFSVIAVIFRNFQVNPISKSEEFPEFVLLE